MISDTKDDNQAKIYMCQGPPGTGNYKFTINLIRKFYFSISYKGKSQTITGIVRALLQVSDICIDFIYKFCI